MSSKEVRKKDPVQDFFNKMEKDGKILARCKKCGREQSNKAERIRKHQETCTESVPVSIQAYAPTSGKSDEVIENFYEQLQETIDKVNKIDIVIIQGDLNTKIGKDAHKN